MDVNLESLQRKSKLVAGISFVAFLIFLIVGIWQLREINHKVASGQVRLDQLKKDIEQAEKKIEDRKKELKDVKEAFKEFYAIVEKTDKQVAETVDQKVSRDPELRKIVEEVENSPLESNTNSGGKPSKDKNTALAKEKEGFQALIDQDFEKALIAFQAAENAYNSFHSCYEIARLLRRNKSQFGDPEKRKQLIKTIVEKHSYGAPADLLNKLKTTARK